MLSSSSGGNEKLEMPLKTTDLDLRPRQKVKQEAFGDGKFARSNDFAAAYPVFSCM